jgi:hypothetical protein
MAVTIHKPQNTKDDTFLIRIANEDNETGWITLHFQSLEDARVSDISACETDLAA